MDKSKAQDLIRSCKAFVCNRLTSSALPADLVYHCTNATLAVKVKISTRPSICAGKYTWRGLGFGHIVVNTFLCNTEEKFHATLCHELCHLLARVAGVGQRFFPDSFGYFPRFREDYHGRTWQSFMVLFGLPPDKYHEYEVPNSYWAVRMPCPAGKHTVSLTQRQVKTILSGKRRLCARCYEEGLISVIRLPSPVDNTGAQG